MCVWLSKLGLPFPTRCVSNFQPLGCCTLNRPSRTTVSTVRPPSTLHTMTEQLEPNLFGAADLFERFGTNPVKRKRVPAGCKVHHQNNRNKTSRPPHNRPVAYHSNLIVCNHDECPLICHMLPSQAEHKHQRRSTTSSAPGFITVHIAIRIVDVQHADTLLCSVLFRDP